MRKKELKLVITFQTTADAMAMEQACRRQQVKGRLIPVPRAITAGCGLAWKAETSEEQVLLDALRETGIGFETHALVELFE